MNAAPHETSFRTATTLPAPPDLPRQCSCCGSVITDAEWTALPFVGVQHFDDERFELRNHACGSTLSRPL